MEWLFCGTNGLSSDHWNPWSWEIDLLHLCVGDDESSAEGYGYCSSFFLQGISFEVLRDLDAWTAARYAEQVSLTSLL